MLCSPQARQSHFVDDEIRRFAESNGIENIIPILVSGIPNNEATPAQLDQMAFPAALCERVEMPLAVDYRGLDPARDKPTSGAFRGAWHTTLANIYGKSRDIIEQREKKRKARRRRILGAVIGGIMTVLLVALIVSLSFWRQAVNQRTIAVARQLAAQAELVRNQQVDLIERSLLLATESMKRSPSLEADLVLRPQLALLAHPVAAVSLGKEVADSAFSPDGRLAASGIWKNVTVWDMVTAKPARVLEVAGSVSSLAFSPDGKHLAVGTGTTSSPTGSGCEIWELDSGERRSRIAYDEPVRDVIFSSDGRRLACRDDKIIRVSELASARVEAELTHERTLLDIAFGPNGRSIAASTNDNEIHRWDVETGREAAALRNESIANAIAVSPDGRRLATTGSITRIWDWTTGAELSRTPQSSGAAIAFTPDGETVATASGSNVIVFDAASGGQKARMEHRTGIVDLAISPDGTSVATASNDDTSRIWTLEGQELTRLAIPFPWRIAFNVDGSQLLTANRDGEIRRWAVTNGGELTVTALEHDDALPDVGAHGQVIATAAEDHIVRIRDVVKPGDPVRVAHDAAPRKLVLAPNRPAISRSSTRSASGSLNGRQAATSRCLASKTPLPISRSHQMTVVWLRYIPATAFASGSFRREERLLICRTTMASKR